MTKQNIYQKILYVSLIIVTLALMFAISSFAMVGEDFQYYGEIKTVVDCSFKLDAIKDKSYNIAIPIPIKYRPLDASGYPFSDWYPRDNGEAPANGVAYIVYDTQYIWVYVEVTDTTLNTYAADATQSTYREDSVELLIDWTNEGLNQANITPYNARISHEGYISGRLGQYGTTLQGTEEQLSTHPVNFFQGTARYTDNGYDCEFRIEIPDDKYDINEYISIGFQINDYDSTGDTRSRIWISADSVNGSSQWLVNKIGYIKLNYEPFMGKCGENLKWSFNADTGTLDITGAGPMYNFKKDCPLTIPWKKFSKDIKSVNMADTVTSIGDYAFANCVNLTSVTIPDSVTSIGSSAFYDCYSLTSMILLSPTTTIYNNSSTIPTTTTIYGFAGSTAEAYADEYSRTFVPFASDLITVFEFSATFEADAENAGVYSSVSTLNRTNNDGTIMLDFLYAEGASGALYIKDSDGAYQPLYGSDGNALALGETETFIAVIYDNKNGLVRYYVNNSLPRYGKSKALAYDLPISDDFTKGDVISYTLTTLDGVDFTNAFTINESGTAEIVALQDNLENSSSIRLLAGVDMLYYGAVGFETELYIGGLAQSKLSEQSGTVYSSVIADTETILPTAYGFRYFATLTIDGVDLSEYNGMSVNLIIKPYTQVGATKYYGSSAKVDITDNGGTYSYTFDESHVG